jgi:hypothetical protein
MTTLLEIPLHRCTWTLARDPWRAVTRFWDGARVEAIPVHDRDLTTAQTHGYGDDTLRLFVHHDLAHSVVMQSLGFSCSFVLRRVATQERDPAWLTQAMRWDEEGLIMGMQAHLHGGPRPTVPAWMGVPDDATRVADRLACLLAGYGLLAAGHDSQTAIFVEKRA